MNGLTSDFASFVRNYNKHNTGKTIGELHALLIEYEKGYFKKAATPQVMAVQGGRIQKSNEKSLNAKGKGKGKDKSYIPKPKNPKPSAKKHPAKDDTCHHYKEVGHCKRNYRAYLAELIKKKKQVGTASTSNIFDYGLESTTRILNMVPIKMVDKTPYELWYGKVHNLSYIKVWGCEALVKWDTPDKLQQRSVKCIFIRYPKEMMGYYFYFPPKNKIVVARYAEFLEKNRISQEVGGRAVELEEIQDEDTSPSENTSEIPMEVKGFEPPQEEVVPIRRSARTHQAPKRLCLNVELKEHSLRDFYEPTNYKAAMLDPKSNKWLDAMNAEIQSIKDNQVWCLVDLPPNSKGFSQTYEVDYEETFSLVAHIRAIRILTDIEAFYDYEIWQMDVKTAFLNGCLDEDIYMVKPEGFVDPNHPRKMNNSKRGNIPMQERLDLNITQDASTLREVKRMQNVPYASAVGEPHWTDVKTILKYLRNTKDMFLVYGRNPEAKLKVDCYRNAGFKTDRDEIKSQIGYVFILNGRCIRLEKIQYAVNQQYGHIVELRQFWVIGDILDIKGSVCHTHMIFIR
ncbi:retrotransposon protein, putative, ty1-copia subclass [Tanacetum coccineum]